MFHAHSKLTFFVFVAFYLVGSLSGASVGKGSNPGQRQLLSDTNDSHDLDQKVDDGIATTFEPLLSHENDTWFINGTRSGNSTDEVTPVISLNFIDSFVKAISVMIVSELGDKTFFLAAILAMRYNKLTVFLGSISSLVLMTVVSALLGWGVTSLIPKIYTFYASVVLMFFFGFKMFWDAWRMKPNEAEELQNEAESEINRRERRASARDPGDEPPPADGELPLSTIQNENAETGDNALPEPEVKSPSRKVFAQFVSSVNCLKGQKFTLAPTEDPAPPITSTPLGEAECAANDGSQPKPPESSRFGKQCLKIFKVFVNSFGLIFLAEWGDRSQLATIVLASVNDVAGVILGGVLGHTFCTGLAVLAGALIAKKISVRAVTIIGGIVFIGFAVATLIFGPEEDHIVVSEDL